MVDGMLLAGGDALLALGTQGTIETALSFRQGSLFSKTLLNLGEITGALRNRQHRLLGTRLLFFALWLPAAIPEQPVLR